MADLIILPALILGVVIGLIEMVFVHSDEIGMGWFAHGLHAFPFTILFTFVSCNIAWALAFVPGGFTSSFWVDLGVRAVIAVIAMIKISAAAAIAGRVGERIHHTIIIGALILASGYLAPFIPLPKISLPF